MDLVTKLAANRMLTSDEFQNLMLTEDATLRAKLFRFAQQVTALNFHNKVYLRGLIEFTTHCQRDCFYCGLRCSNKHAERYRLTKEQILECCKEGYALGFRTFILQGGEDHFFTDNVMCDIIYSIKTLYKDCAITLSIGERSLNAYKMFYDAGANRYLLRHETADSLPFALYKNLDSHLSPSKITPFLLILIRTGPRIVIINYIRTPFSYSTEVPDDFINGPDKLYKIVYDFETVAHLLLTIFLFFNG